jgi:sugar/nucleoside kinase (ribokinase family)
MKLINRHEAETLLDFLPDQKKTSGGSAANSAAGIAVLGGEVRFVGKVADDALGDLYVSDLTSLDGISFNSSRLSGSENTAISAIIVTDDGERTMNTYLGACLHLEQTDILERDVKGSEVIFFEGYLWDQPKAREAALKAIDIARASPDTRIAITLSDANCVRRHLAAFNDLINTGKVDLVLANKQELLAIYSADTIDSAILSATNSKCDFAVTLGSKGATVIENGAVHFVKTKPVSKIVDLVGAGDAFAAGLLLGYSRNEPLAKSAGLGCDFASEIIQTEGARIAPPHNRFRF